MSKRPPSPQLMLCLCVAAAVISLLGFLDSYMLRGIFQIFVALCTWHFTQASPKEASLAISDQSKVCHVITLPSTWTLRSWPSVILPHALTIIDSEGHAQINHTLHVLK